MKVFKGQEWHFAWPASGWKVPGRQGMQEVLLAVEKEPEGQSVQKGWPVRFW
jgi:hypothetical protein